VIADGAVLGAKAAALEQLIKHLKLAEIIFNQHGAWSEIEQDWSGLRTALEQLASDLRTGTVKPASKKVG